MSHRKGSAVGSRWALWGWRQGSVAARLRALSAEQRLEIGQQESCAIKTRERLTALLRRTLCWLDRFTGTPLAYPLRSGVVV